MSSLYDLQDMQNRLAIAIFDCMPSGWSRSTSVFVNLGVASRIQRSVLTADGPLPGPLADLAEWQAWSELRSAMSDESRGAWFTGRLHLDSTGAYRFDFDWDAEPQWPVEVDLDGNLVRAERVESSELREDMARYPRDAASTPHWLIERLAVNPVHFIDEWQSGLDSLSGSANWTIVREMVRDAIQAGTDEERIGVESDQVAEAVYSDLVAATNVGQVMRLHRDAREARVLDFLSEPAASPDEPTREALEHDRIFLLNVRSLMPLLDRLAAQELASAQVRRLRFRTLGD